MTKAEFINWLKDDVTLDGAIGINLPTKTY